MLTQLAKRKLDAVIAEACEAQFKLEFSPSTTAELANSITFLDEIQERVRHAFHVNSSFFISHVCDKTNKAMLFLQYILQSPLYLFLSDSFLLHSILPLSVLSLSPDYGARRGAGDNMSDVQSD